MKKLRRKKLAFALACASILGGEAQAMDENKPKSPQSVAAVGGATSRDNQSVKQGLTKNQKLGITAAITTLVAVPAVALTIWGIKKHINEKLLDFFIKFLDSDFDYYSITENNAEIVQITEEVCKTWNPFILDVRGLLGCIKDKKLEIDELKKINKSFTDFEFDYGDNDNIELIVYFNGEANKVTIAKIDNSCVSVHTTDPNNNSETLVLKAK
ncbi:MAG: hypothetical protein IJQ10_01250 [Clostridia bacterium]|nr:hypothetical protein [Clostridia bacterium]